MDYDFIDRVYDTLHGNLTEAACVPDVENLFAEGTLCDSLYDNIHAANARLLDRLDAQNEDQDLEIIVNSFLGLCRETGRAMYHLGTRFASKQ